jgi:predicted component of type VI protein secretion system
MYGGQPAAYGATMAQPGHGAVADPYGQAPAAAAGAVARAVMSGAAGTYSVALGMETKVGRDAAKCHITLTEPRVSGVHATLKLEGGQLYVRDEQSNNGTFVDGHRLAPNVWTVAPAGGVLRFGPVEFNIRIE